MYRTFKEAVESWNERPRFDIGQNFITLRGDYFETEGSKEDLYSIFGSWQDSSSILWPD